MAEFPAFPVFTDAYLGDTTHLTTIEHGAYLLLLFVAWRSPGKCLPDDDAKLAKYARMTHGQWSRIAPTIREFFVARDGSLYQSRLTDEAKHVRQVREKQSAAGKVSALKRKGRHSTDVQHTFNECATPSPSPSPSPAKEDNPIGLSARKRVPAVDIAQPNDVDDQIWSDFGKHRRKIGAPITATVISGYRREAEKAGISLGEAMAHSCTQAWRGFKAEWYLKDANNGRGSENGMAGYREHSTGSRTLDAGLDFISDGRGQPS